MMTEFLQRQISTCKSSNDVQLAGGNRKTNYESTSAYEFQEACIEAGSPFTQESHLG